MESIVYGMGSIDWETIAKVAVGVGAIGGLLAQLVRPRARANLKTDIEILKELDPADASYTTLKTHVDREVAWIYGQGAANRQTRIALGAAELVAGAGAVVYALTSDGAWWVYAVAIYLLFGGCATIMLVYVRRRERPETQIGALEK